MTTRFSSVGRDRIEYSLWLIFDNQGGCRMSRGMPSVQPYERAMSLSVGLPTALFRTPQLSAKVEIGDPGSPPPRINVDAAEAALKAVIGCDVSITVNTPE